MCQGAMLEGPLRLGLAGDIHVFVLTAGECGR